MHCESMAFSSDWIQNQLCENILIDGNKADRTKHLWPTAERPRNAWIDGSTYGDQFFPIHVM